MKLSVKFLKNVADINNFQYASEWYIAEGSIHRLYFQIVDELKDGLRYISQATVIDAVTVTFLSIDDDTEIVKTATQAWSDDKSIWYIDLAVNEVPNSGAVKFSITEDGVQSQFKVPQGIMVELLESGGC
jgi:hypothetical protein